MRYKEWDSQVLGVGVYELEYIYEAPLAHDYSFIKISPYDIKRIQYMEEYGFNICDVSVQYFLDLRKSPTYDTYGVRHLINLDVDRVLDITKGSFYLDRFHKDPNLTEEQADNMYQAWVTNACNGTYGDAVFVAEVNNNVVGYSACRINGQFGNIDLTAIDINNRDVNVGPNLLAADINFFINQGLPTVLTSTQIDNYPSRSSLLRFGFEEYGLIATMSKGRKNA